MLDRQTDRQTDRFSHIDLIESIAILFVVIYHTTIYSFDFIHDNSVKNYVLYYLRTLLSTCVPLFFFANGYLLFNRPFELTKHIKRTFRLFVLAFIWAAILLPTYMVVAGEKITLGVFVKRIINLDIEWGMNLFWFLGALICMYILFPALKSLFDSNKKAFVWFTIVCAVLTFGVVLGSQVLSLIGTFTHRSVASFSSFLYHPMFTMINPFRGSYGYSFVYFCVGGLIYIYEDRIRAVAQTKRNIISVVGIIASCGLLFTYGIFCSKMIDGSLWDVVWNGYDTISTFANVIFIFVLSLNYHSNISIVKSISSNTLGIYFLHVLIIRLTKPWVKSVDALCNLPFNIIYALMIVLVCLAICLLIRKIPILKKLI